MVGFGWNQALALKKNYLELFIDLLKRAYIIVYGFYIIRVTERVHQTPNEISLK